MNIAEMHVWFRQYAQQMGMQNVRAILPEQIDLLINTSITDTINQLIQQNIGVTNDRVITDNSKIGQINAFKTLYTVLEIPLLAFDRRTQGQIQAQHCAYFSLDNQNARIGKMTTNWSTEESTADNPPIKLGFPNYLFLVDFSINYLQAQSPDPSHSIPDGGIVDGTEGEYDTNAQITNYFPVRLIDDAYLADTLNDFVLKPRLRSPIIVAYNNPTNLGQNVEVFNTDGESLEGSNVILDLYIDEFVKPTGWYGYALKYGNSGKPLLPYKLRVSFIKRPNKVLYAADVDGTNVDCDLPESMHIDILKHAVDLYRVAVNGSLYSSQQQEQQQQREDTRNNYRNEGQQPQRQQIR